MEPPMDRDCVIAKLREHEAELKGIGAFVSVRFESTRRRFGSIECRSYGGVDAGKKFSLLDMVSMENRLADILNVPVDLAPAKSLKDGVRERAIREAVLAF
jgi:uncharacterized protein